MKTIVITGGTGFIGLSLARHLSEQGLRPVLVGRNAPKADIGFEFVRWDVTATGAWLNALSGAYAIVNLAGRTVDCIKTPDHCDEILRSRVDSTMAIGQALKTVTNPPKIWIQMSTAHIYGDPPVQICTESSSIGYGLAPSVGKAWERALRESIPTGTREVRLRTSFVIGRNGGAIQKLAKLTRAGLGGRVGRGVQGMSWIHQDDLNALIYQSIMSDKYHGVYNATAPHPVSNHEFMTALRKQLNVPVGIPTPSCLVRIGARFIFKTDPELALYGRYVISERLDQDGFVFQYARLDDALKQLFVNPRKR